MGKRNGLRKLAASPPSLWAMALLALSSGFALASALLLTTGFMPVW